MPRVLGLDFGTRRIGVAVSDPLGLTAQPVTVLTRRGTPEDLEALAALAAAQGAGTIVLGLPLTPEGRRGPQAQRVLAFGEALARRTGLPLAYVDERMTTAQGERALRETGAPGRRRRQVIDRVAAQLILQQYLDGTRRDPTRS